MKLISCDTMREGIIVSMSLLFVGAALVFLSASIIPDIFHLPKIIMFLGMICLLIAPITIISTFIVTVWPGSKKEMDQCDR